MANVFAVHSVGASLVRYLDTSYPAPLRTAHPCNFRLLSSGDLTAAASEAFGTTLSLYLYRISIDEHLRNAGRPGSEARPMSIDLHYLMSIWTTSALTEQLVFTWAMRQFHQHAVLDLSSLSPEGGWAVGDTVQLIPAEIPIEVMMRIWDALEPPYKLSTCYTARVVRIDADEDTPGLPVVARRFSYTDEGGQL
jgi:hypothetical protein